MFDNDIFEKWLDEQANIMIKKVGAGESLKTEEMIILVLKAQSNHFSHLDTDLRKQMNTMDSDLRKDIRDLRIDMNKRFEQVDKKFEETRFDMNKRFEQVDRRFEQVDKRFDRVYSFLKWEIGLFFVAFAGLYIKLFLG